MFQLLKNRCAKGHSLASKCVFPLPLAVCVSVCAQVQLFTQSCAFKGALAPGPGKGRGAKRKQQQQEGTAAGATKRTRRYRMEVHIKSDAGIKHVVFESFGRNKIRLLRICLL